MEHERMRRSYDLTIGVDPCFTMLGVSKMVAWTESTHLHKVDSGRLDPVHFKIWCRLNLNILPNLSHNMKK